MGFIKKICKIIWKIYSNKKEICNYLIFGFFGVIISIVSYWICRKFGLSIEISNVLSWIVAVVSMYVTNKIFVFRSKCKNIKENINEFVSFVLARVFTLFIETAIIYIGANFIGFSDIIVKFFAQIIVIILNYILSKIIIFKK